MRTKINTANFMYFPALFLIIVFIIYPFLSGLHFSLTDWNGFSQKYNYIGLKNYLNLFSDANFHRVLKNTLFYGIGSTLLQQILGLSYALLLRKKFRGRVLARTIIYLPVLLSGIVVGYMWYFLFRYNRGALNDILQLFSIEKRDWLGNPSFVVPLIVVVNTIQFVGTSMVIYLAGLTAIPKMYYEASSLEGASPRQQFFYISLPLLQPALLSSITVNLIGGFKIFGIIVALTNGGPGYASHSISTFIQHLYTQSELAGYASALGVVLFLIILVFTVVILNFFERIKVEI